MRTREMVLVLINGNIFSDTFNFRLTFAAAREGHLPRFLAMIHTKRRTPLPGLIFSVSSSFLGNILMK